MDKKQSYDFGQDEAREEETGQEVLDFGSNQKRGRRANGEASGQEQAQGDSSFHSYGASLANSADSEVASLTSLVPRYVSLAQKASFGGGRAHQVSSRHKRRLQKLEDQMELSLDQVETTVSEAKADFDTLTIADLRGALRSTKGRSALQTLKSQLKSKYKQIRKLSRQLYQARTMLRQDAGYRSDTARSVNLRIKGIGHTIKSMRKRIEKAEE